MTPIPLLAVALTWLFSGASAYATDGDAAYEKRFWGEVNLKYWESSYRSSGHLAVANMNNLFSTLTLGWGKVFWTAPFEISSAQWISDPTYPGGQLRRYGDSFGIGYKITPDFAFAIGEKYAGEEFGNGITVPRTNYTTLSTLINCSIPDTQAILRGDVSMGYGKTFHSSTFRKYFGYEVGVSYPILISTKVFFGYKTEILELASPVNVNGVWDTLNGFSNGIARQSGIFTGIGYSF